MWLFFKQKKLSYNLREGPISNLQRTQSTCCGTNPVHFQSCLVWNKRPAKISNLKPMLKIWEIHDFFYKKNIFLLEPQFSLHNA